MGNIPFAFTIVVLALLFSFAEQGSDGEEIFLYFFFLSVPNLMYLTLCRELGVTLVPMLFPR